MLMLGTVGAQAQIVTDEELDETFQFVDELGNVVANGSTIVVTEINKEGQMIVPLYVKNTAGEKAAVSMYEDLSQQPNGDWQTCAFGNCMNLEKSGYSAKNIVAEDYNADIQTEWIPEPGKYGTWEAKLQIHIFNITTKMQFGTPVQQPGNEVIGYGPVVTVRFEYKDPDAQPAETHVISPSTTETLGQSAGFGNYATGKLAVFNEIPVSDIDIFDGGKVVKMRVGLAEAAEISHLYIYPIYGGYIQDPVVSEEVSGGAAGWNDFELSTPVTLNMEQWESILIGFEYNQATNAYPLSITSSNYSLVVYGNLGQGVSYYSAGAGDLSIQAIVEKTLDKYNVQPSYFGDFVLSPGESASGYMYLRNRGAETVNNISYTLNIGGTAGAEQTVNVSSALTLGQQGYVEIPFTAASTEGTQNYVVTVTKVNGEPNVNSKNAVEGLLATTSRTVEHRVAVEEYTGTMCGWCPRGLVGMEKMRAEYGDKFVGIGIHQYNPNTYSSNNYAPDAMYLNAATYASLPFTGAPSCMLNRMVMSDPYYGFTSQNGSIINDFKLVLDERAHAGLTVTGEWNADSTQVKATATIDPLVNGAEYTIEYALVADGLTGDGQGWQQVNYYNSAYGQFNRASQLPSDLQFLFNAGEIVNNQWVGYRPVFNDVCIAGSYVDYENQTDELPAMTAGQTVENSYTLSMPTYSVLAKAIQKDKVWVVALLVNRLGEVVNAAKALMPGSTEGVNASLSDNPTVQSRYSLDGRQLPEAKKGLNIVRMSDGTVKKVVVK